MLVNNLELEKFASLKGSTKYYKTFPNLNQEELNGFLNILNNSDKTFTNDEAIEILKKYRVFYTSFEIFNNKFLFFKKTKGKFYFYINYFHNYFAKFIKLLEEINDKKEILDFNLICFSFKFYPLFEKNNPQPFKIFAPSQQNDYLDNAFIPYYLLRPDMLDSRCEIYKKFNFIDIYNEVIEKSKEPYQISKAIFRGSENNELRTELFNLEHDLLDVKRNDYVNFIDYMKYKYIIDLWGIVGHSGRRYFYLLFNRVIFLPKEDKNKQFFEIWENPIKPNVHYIEYSVNNMQEIVTKIEFLENNPEEYQRIRDNCRNYAENYLNYDKIIDFIRNSVQG